jgi:syntaxin-binding protein 3
MNQFTCHTNLISQLMNEVLTDPTQSVVVLEQLIVTGVDDSGNIKDANHIVDRVLREAPRWPEVMRLRVVLLCAVCMDIGEKQRQALWGLLSASDLSAVMNLRLLGSKIGSLSKKSTSLVDRDISRRAQAQLKSTRMKFSYSVSRLSDIIQQTIESRLDQEVFRFVKGLPPSYQGIPPPAEAVTNFRKKNVESKASRVIVFVIGGLSYSEIRCVSGLTSQVVIGGSSLLSPQLYMQELMSMSQRADHEEVNLDLR